MPSLICKRKTSRATGCNNSIWRFENRSSPYIRDEYWRDLEMWVRVRSNHWKYAAIRQMAYEFLFVFHCKGALQERSVNRTVS